MAAAAAESLQFFSSLTALNQRTAESLLCPSQRWKKQAFEFFLDIRSRQETSPSAGPAADDLEGWRRFCEEQEGLLEVFGGFDIKAATVLHVVANELCGDNGRQVEEEEHQTDEEDEEVYLTVCEEPTYTAVSEAADMQQQSSRSSVAAVVTVVEQTNKDSGEGGEKMWSWEEDVVNLFGEAKTKSRWLGWLFAALCCLDDLQAMDADVGWDLQRIRRQLEQDRGQKAMHGYNGRRQLAALNLFITIIRDFFIQI
eukprot:GHVS01051542.1.p1 GENE.GHVS01051542.1~~GHVS01051542.1.p1  ORF type:complete len:255 (+),score=61.09 GHVS01051542.1:314-1078(+)